MEPKTNWEAISEEEKESWAFDQLAQIDLEHADPDFSARFLRAKANSTDPAARKQLDLQMFDRVSQLRNEGKMLSGEQILEKAKAMAKLKPDEMLKNFNAFSEELRKPKQA